MVPTGRIPPPDILGGLVRHGVELVRWFHVKWVDPTCANPAGALSTPSMSTSTLKSRFETDPTPHGRVHRSCTSLPLLLLRWTILSASLASTRLPGLVAVPTDGRAILASATCRLDPIPVRILGGFLYLLLRDKGI